MVARKPLVLVSGKIQQLQSGDSLNIPTLGVDLVTVTNAEATSIVIGAPVYIFGADSVKKARANAVGTSDVIALVYDTSIGASSSGNVALDGLVTATTGQWDAVTGQTGGLTVGATYYLDPSTAGMLTTTAPSTVGQTVVNIGFALSTTEMLLSIEDYILL
jgi:hypothetical protein